MTDDKEILRDKTGGNDNEKMMALICALALMVCAASAAAEGGKALKGSVSDAALWTDAAAADFLLQEKSPAESGG